MSQIRRHFLIALACTLSIACTFELAMAQDANKLQASINRCSTQPDLKARESCKMAILFDLSNHMPDDHRFDQAVSACVYSSSPRMLTQGRYETIYDRCLDIALTYFVSHLKPVSSIQEKAEFLTLLCSSMDEESERAHLSNSGDASRFHSDLVEMKRSCLNSAFESTKLHVASDPFQNKIQEIAFLCASESIREVQAHSLSIDKFNSRQTSCEETRLLSMAGKLVSLKPDSILEAVNASRAAKATQESRAREDRQATFQNPFATVSLQLK